jgi:hypothetical protein
MRPAAAVHVILSSPSSFLVQYDTTVGVTLISTIASLSGPSSNHRFSSSIQRLLAMGCAPQNFRRRAGIALILA